ncbi:MAG: RidA family protein [Gammaproteobacteria bacterium]
MEKEVIATANAPAAIGTYSQAVRAGEWIFLSGQIGLDPATGALVEGGIEVETRRAFDNLRAVAVAGGADLESVVKLTLYLTDLGDYAMVNELMREFFAGPYPARAAVGVAALPRGACVEVEAIAVTGRND